MNKKLTRSNSNIMIGGVAAGIADYLNVDPVLIRLLFVLAALFGGHGILIYFILWLIMPEESVAANWYKNNLVSKASCSKLKQEAFVLPISGSVADATAVQESQI